MAAQVDFTARIAGTRGVQQRLTARKSVNPTSDEDRNANDELDEDIAKLNELRAALQALQTAAAAVPPQRPATALPAVDLIDYVSIQAYIDRRKAENANIAFEQL
jgi:hypothetical protein